MDYTELIKEWKESLDEWQNYEFQCANVAGQIYVILKKSLNITDEKLFKLIDPEEQNEEKIKTTLYAPIGATKLVEKGWAKFGLYLVLQIAENTWPKKALRFTVFVKIDDEFIWFKITGDDNEEKLSLDLNAIDESIVISKFENLMHNHIRDSFKNWQKEV